jgi:hypothetical protein
VTINSPFCPASVIRASLLAPYTFSRFLNPFCQTNGKKGTMMISFYQKYRNTILFNKNLLISGIISFLVGALFTQIYAQYDENHILNS